jgi:non-specific protein-tyrosine kinase
VDPGAPPATGAPSSQEALKAARYAAAVQYETLYSRQQELLVDISLKRGDADLIATAKTPGAPISPHPKKDAALGLSIGLLLGVGISIAREQFGDRVRSAQEIERITGLPMLTQLPFDAVSAKDASSLAVVDRPLGSLSESLRSLRTSIQYLGVDRPIKVIVVTSAVPGEGKSLVSANLGAVFAQAGYRTLLISGDLRRSSVERLFAMPEKSDGLTGVLAPFATNAHAAHSGNGASGANGSNGATGANGVHRGGANGSTGQVPIDDAGLVRAVVRTSVPSLRLLPSGPTPPNPAELLGSARMGTVLDGYAGLFDVIVIDTPPLLAVTDAAVLASKADGVVLVTAVNETRRDGLRRAMAVLEGTGGVLLGTVVNKVTKSQGYYNYDSTYYGTYSGDRRRRRRDRTYEGAGAEPPRLRTGTG